MKQLFSLFSAYSGGSSVDEENSFGEASSDKTLRTIAMAVVLIVWTTNMLMDSFIKNYDPSPFIHGAMMLVLGRLLGLRVGKK